MPPSARKRPASASAPRRFLNTEGDGAREGIDYCGYARIKIAPVGGGATTFTIRGATPTLRLEHSVALPAAADADKIALELAEDGRLLVRVEKPPAPPEPTQIPIVKRVVVAEEKLVEPPPKDAAALETELDSKFAVAPSPEAEATATAEIADAEKAEAEAAA